MTFGCKDSLFSRLSVIAVKRVLRMRKLGTFVDGRGENPGCIIRLSTYISGQSFCVQPRVHGDNAQPVFSRYSTQCTTENDLRFVIIWNETFCVISCGPAISMQRRELVKNGGENKFG